MGLNEAQEKLYDNRGVVFIFISDIRKEIQEQPFLKTLLERYWQTKGMWNTVVNLTLVSGMSISYVTVGSRRARGHKLFRETAE